MTPEQRVKLIRDYLFGGPSNEKPDEVIAEQIRQAVAEEREAIMSRVINERDDDMMRYRLVSAIRARGE